MPGEAYLQFIIDQLNGVSVRGAEDMSRMLKAIQLLERLKSDIIEHKMPEIDIPTEDAAETVTESNADETQETV